MGMCDRLMHIYRCRLVAFQYASRLLHQHSGTISIYRHRLLRLCQGFFNGGDGFKVIMQNQRVLMLGTSFFSNASSASFNASCVMLLSPKVRHAIHRAFFLL
jgi:hypothetical protein